MRVAGIVALSDPPRSDSKPMIDQLRALGVHTVMVTGDAATTAAFVLRTMTLVTLAFNGQAVFYVVRERKRLWSSRPSAIVMLSSVWTF